ncbi:DNA cytosine methyltransferase [Enterococcus faecalis]
MGNLIAIDLFSGAGGTTSGLKKAGIRVSIAVEFDKKAVETYKKNNPEVEIICEDIRKVDSSMLEKKINKTKEDRLLLVACPPCQGFSSIGKKGTDDERNLMIFEFLRFINELKPDFILMENVAGMTRGVGKEIFRKFEVEIKSDYDIIYDILNAADYGVPQSRKRLVLHGVRRDIKGKLKNEGIEISLPDPTHDKNGDGLPEWINADIILDLPSIEAGTEYEGDNIYNHVSNGLSEINIQRMKYIRSNGGNRNSLPDNLSLKCHKKTKGHSDVYGILNINKPAITITGGCMSYSKGRFGHPYQNRALSAREAARLQSFDDNYVFVGNRGDLARQIGNAVPVKLAQASGLYFKRLYNILRGKIENGC